MKKYLNLTRAGRNGWLAFAALLLPFSAVIIFCIASASYITVSLICMLCLASVFLLLRKCGSRLMPVIFCLLAAIFLWSFKPVIWLNDWNPFVIIFPLLLTFVSFTAVAAGFHVFLPVAVAAGSFSVQTHIGSLPSVAAAAVFAGIFLVIRF